MILYVTNTAASGDGSFADCVANASDGDTITTNLTDAINVASTFTIRKALTFERLIFAGTSGAEQANFVLRSACVFRDCLFFRFRRLSSFGCVTCLTECVSATFTRCRFQGNYSERYGAALYVQECAFVLEDSLVAGNYSGTAHAVRFANDPGTIRNCTLADNIGGNTNGTPVDSLLTSENCVQPYDATAETWDADDALLANYYVPDGLALAENPSNYDVEGNPRVVGNIGAYDSIGADVYYSNLADLSTNGKTERYGSTNVLPASLTEPTIFLTAPRGLPCSIAFRGYDPELISRPTIVLGGFTSWQIVGSGCADFILGYGASLTGTYTGSLSAPDATADPPTYAGISSFEATFSGTTANFNVAKENDRPVAFFRGSQYLGQDLDSVTIDDTTQAVDFAAFDGLEDIETTATRTYYYKGDPLAGSFANKDDWSISEDRSVPCIDAPTINDCVFYVR